MAVLPVWQLVIVAVCLLVLAVVSLAEAALVRLDLGRARQLAAERRRAGRQVLALIEHRQEVLSTLVVVLNLCVIVASSYTTSIAISLAGGSTRLVPAFSAGMVAFILLFCELTPKTYAVGRAEAVALATAPALRFFHLLLRPLTRLLHVVAVAMNRRLLVPLLGGRVTARWSRYTDEEVIELVAAGEAQGSVEEEEREMIEGVIEFADKVVREVMTPRTDVVGVPANASLAQAAEVSRNSGYSRLPVCQENADHIVGILYAKDLVSALQSDGRDKTAEEIARTPAPMVPESKKLHEVFQLMQRNRLHMVIVIDEYGGTAGLATIEDLIEEIFGELQDEYDAGTEPIRKVAEDTLVVDARVGVGEVEDELEVRLPEGEYDSVGGLILDLLGRLPAVGEQVSWRNVTFTVESVSRNRIRSVRVVRGEPLPEEEEGEDEEG